MWMKESIRVRGSAAWVLVAVLVPVVGCRSGGTVGPGRTVRFERLDPTAAASQAADGQRIWYDAWQLALEGKGWRETERPFDRLPARAKGVVRDPVWNLSRHSAGLCVRFVTDASCIAACWKLTGSNLAMPHMPATGVSGLDLYVRLQTGWWFIGAGRPDGQANERELAKGIPPGMHEYLLYLPLYNGVESLQIGVPTGATMARPTDRRGRPIVFYGTSIVQGGCASRPGMAYAAIVGRRLDRETINLGFSGNGRMDIELADLLGEIDAAAYVLDCLPNMKMEMVAERVEPFVRRLRQARPTVPIVLVESIAYPAQDFMPNPESGYEAENRLLREVYQRLNRTNVRDLFYVPGRQLYGVDGEGTVDGCHGTDLGFHRFADVLEPVLDSAVRFGGSG